MLLLTASPVGLSRGRAVLTSGSCQPAPREQIAHEGQMCPGARRGRLTHSLARKGDAVASRGCASAGGPARVPGCPSRALCGIWPPELFMWDPLARLLHWWVWGKLGARTHAWARAATGAGGRRWGCWQCAPLVVVLARAGGALVPQALCSRRACAHGVWVRRWRPGRGLFVLCASLSQPSLCF
jgi:hypothetical protein